MQVMTDKELTEVRRLFPVTERYVYFDHASTGPLPLSGLAAVKGYLEQSAEYGQVFYLEAEAVAEECRERLGRLMKVPAASIAFTKNTSAGIILAIGSIEWQSGDNVVLMKDDFPAVTYPFRLLLPEVEKRWVTSAELVQGPSAVFRLVDENTRCVALSWVSFLDGSRYDIAAVSRFCRTRGIWFIVDAIQGLGVVDCDFGSVGTDFVCSHGAKWLLSPQGSGFMHIRPDRLPALKPYNLGWLSARWTAPELRSSKVEVRTSRAPGGCPAVFNDIFTMKPMHPDARRFEEGTKNYLAIYGMNESLKLFERLGMARIEAHIRALNTRLRQGLEHTGFEIVTPGEPERSAGIVTCRRPGADMTALHQRLTDAKLVCSLRENVLRISPHFYNTEEEVERFLEGVADAGN